MLRNEMEGGGYGGDTDHHRSASRGCMFQHYLHYEGVCGVSNFQKKIITPRGLSFARKLTSLHS